ncbi:hypothetical protein [Bacillus sp. Marseille-Q1617]|uniref:hypothetical protein n=1 Tax=Bacillus sp. Marseille-Q1617 TaxID=2736887 RepID=UPI00158F2303|nr:hypothetical protein [Bacillus sp. Marseille-Q1617]
MVITKLCTDENCSRKNQSLNIETEFYAHRGGKYGKRAICKECYHKRYGKKERAAAHKRKNRLLINNSLTEEEELMVREDFEGKCALSGKVYNVQLDHFVPLSWGRVAAQLGIGGTNYANMLPLNETLNKSKSYHNPFEWIIKAKERHNIDTLMWEKAIEYIASKNNMSVADFESRVNECHRIILEMTYVRTLERRMTLKKRRITMLHIPVIKAALEKGINIEAAVSKYGNLLVRKHVELKEVQEAIRKIKSELSKLK